MKIEILAPNVHWSKLNLDILLHEAMKSIVLASSELNGSMKQSETVRVDIANTAVIIISNNPS